MPSNLRSVAQLFRGGRSIWPRRNFSSPANNDESNRAGTIYIFAKDLIQFCAGLPTGYYLGIFLTGNASSRAERRQREHFALMREFDGEPKITS